MEGDSPRIYDHSVIENKWQDYWMHHGVYTITEDENKPKYYVLDMFPYPSGAGLHVGHPRGYVASDVYARRKRMQGFNVLHPIGFDSFGLPAEQYAIQTGNHPGPYTEELIQRYREQLEMIGMSYDWSRVVATHRPDFYRWTQWIFLRLYDHYYDIYTHSARPIARLIAEFAEKGNTNTTAYTTSQVQSFTADEWCSFSPGEQQLLLMNYRLAYEGYADVNWCAELGTVLANDEILTNSHGQLVSERGGYPVERKKMRQWFMRITAYADRLLSGLESLDWTEHIKTIQRNWVGKSEGSEIGFALRTTDGNQSLGTATVFTTRADTLFGVTYIVLAPEHELITTLLSQVSNRAEVEKYIDWAQSRGEDDRIASKEKTGVCLRGVTAINPANGDSVPVWIADYVLASYGTGAVMAVPAHDERDWEFAKKYNLPIKGVIEPLDINTGPGKDAYQNGVEEVERENVVCIIEHPTEDTFLCAVWKQVDWKGFVTGGIEAGCTPEETARHEISEETGYKNIAQIQVFDTSSHGLFYHVVKKQNRLAHYRVVYAKLADLGRDEISEEEKAIADFVWVKKDMVKSFLMREDMRYPWRVFQGEIGCVTDDGILSHSGNFTGLKSEIARKKITESVGGKVVTKYKMRDAIFARQRYWGEPIPLRHDTHGNITPLPDTELPLHLPDVQSYQPTGTGESPLASVLSWVDAGYETNTMPGWAGSSWYWLRYMDPYNDTTLASSKALQYWQNVDMYVGGAEHATGHLLYSRFWNKFLYDIGIVPTEEPFIALRNQGMILGSDSRKMSKRWGNTVTPDEMVNRFGADAFRMYECFIGPFDASQPWIIDGVVGCRRFLEKVWRQASKCSVEKTTSDALQKLLHKTIKKVGEDIDAFKFNTAVAAMMELVNEMDRTDFISISDFTSFLKILSPFAPHIVEELYQSIYSDDASTSIHTLSWPQWDAQLIVDDVVTIGVQINGKSRGSITVAVNATESQVIDLVKNDISIAKWLNQDIKKVIYVPGKILNIVSV